MIDGEARPDETEEERLDRNLEELLAELRVTITGVQVLFAFLLTVPFNGNVAGLAPLQKALYLVSLLGAGGATALLLAPTAHHRLTFRLQDKRALLPRANSFAIGGLALLAVAMSAALALVVSVVFGTAAAVAAAVGAVLTFTLLWGALPLARRRKREE